MNVGLIIELGTMQCQYLLDANDAFEQVRTGRDKGPRSGTVRTCWLLHAIPSTI